MKRTRKPLRKQSKESVAKLQRRLWVYCRMLVRKLYGNECYTCGAKDLEGSNYQTGHFLPKSTCGAFLRYDIRVLRPQCARCNLWGGGEGAEFLRKMIIREGQEYVDQIFKDKMIILDSKSAKERYEYLIEKYRIQLQDLGVEDAA